MQHRKYSGVSHCGTCAEQSHLTGKDFVCKDMTSKETIAYFRAVMMPQSKAGKLEISNQASFLCPFLHIPHNLSQQALYLWANLHSAFYMLVLPAIRGPEKPFVQVADKNFEDILVATCVAYR